MSQSLQFLREDLPPRPVEVFRELGEQYATEWRRAGVRATFTRTHDLDHFRSAPEKIQRAAISYLEFNLSVLSEMNESGESLQDTKKFLWRALRRLGLIPPSEMMDLIEDEDVVEIYLMDEIQVFRNWKFLEIVSVTIEDILCLPWYKLGARGWRPMLAMARLIVPFKMGLIRGITPWNVPEHVVEEINSVEKVKFSILLKYFVPLKRNGKVVATLSTNRCTLISRTPETI